MAALNRSLIASIAFAFAVPLASSAQPVAHDGIGAAHPQLLLKSLEQRLGTNPFDAVSLNNLAVIKLAEEDPFAAAELLARAQRLAPDNRIILDNHARVAKWLVERAPKETPEATSEQARSNVPPEPPPLWPLQ